MGDASPDAFDFKPTLTSVTEIYGDATTTTWSGVLGELMKLQNICTSAQGSPSVSLTLFAHIKDVC